MTSTSEQGIEFLKAWEGFESQAYADGGGYETIGYGHLILPTDPDFSGGITREEGEEILRSDVKDAETSLYNLAPGITLAQHQHDALVAFVFNIGEEKIRRQGRNTLAALRNEDWDRLAVQMKKWVNSGGKPLSGLKRRREAEARLLLTGEYVYP